MRLFIKNSSGDKKYLNVSVSSRKELSNKIGSDYIEIENNTYHVSQVMAEQTTESTPVSTVIGGALGLVGGMPGVLIGGAIGAILGNDSDKREKSSIEAFNRS